MIFQAARKEKNENNNNNNNEIRIGNDDIIEINNEKDNLFYDDRFWFSWRMKTTRII